MATNIPSLPPKKHRSSSAIPTTVAATMCNVEHDYDEFCAQQQQQQKQFERESKQQRQAARAALERLSSLTTGTSSSKHHHQQGRAATFDLEDARDYELQRLGHRRSQQQQQLQLQLQHGKQSQASQPYGGSLGKHRGERTHDRERSRSDHRIASYICDDPSVCRLLPNGNMSVQPLPPQQQQQQQHQTPQQLLLQRQQRREKTFKV